MKCDEMEILLSAYIDGEVTVRESQVVAEHVTRCQHCRTMLTDFEKLHNLYQGMEKQEAPSGFRQRVTQRIDARPRFGFAWRLPRFAYALSLALLVLLSGVAITVYLQKERPLQQASLADDVYAEDILFGQTGWSVDEIFSVEETSPAEEILNTIEADETDTSLIFGPAHPSPNQTPRTYQRLRDA